MQRQDKSELTARVWDRVNALPQREVILESDARAWVDEVVGNYGDLALWHAARAGGFGGSQIGALVKNYMNERADHEASARDIVAGALLRKLPDESNGHMRRGVAMEPQHRIWFHEKYGSRRDEIGFAVLSKSIGPRPWMRYSPDELAFMSFSGQEKRVLIDFKAPSNVDPKASIAFQYTCQLHMGKLVLEHNNLPVDALMLSQFDWANWNLKDDMVPFIPELDQMILQAGDHYWAFVMRGELPPYVRKDRLEDESKIRENLGDAPLKLARLKALKTVIERHITTFEEQIKPELTKYRLGRNKVQLEGISYAATPKFDKAEVLEKLPLEVFDALPLAGANTKRYDEDALLKKLRELGVDIKQFAKPGSVDPDALYDALVEHNLDADALVGEQLRSTVDKKLSQDVVAWFEREFADHLPGTETAVEEAKTQEKSTEAAPVAASETDGREGQEVSPYVPRPVSA